MSTAHAMLDHPLIDGDSHIIEHKPPLIDYFCTGGGNEPTDRITRENKAAVLRTKGVAN